MKDSAQPLLIKKRRFKRERERRTRRILFWIFGSISVVIFGVIIYFNYFR